MSELDTQYWGPLHFVACAGGEITSLLPVFNFALEKQDPPDDPASGNARQAVT